MILQPDVRLPARKAWGTLVGVLVVGAGLALWVSDPGDVPTQLDETAKKWRPPAAAVDLARRIQDSRTANQHLAHTIEILKKGIGFPAKDPFVVPPGHPQPGQYFNEQYVKVRQELLDLAHGRSLKKYDDRLGFTLSEKVPDDKDAPYLLTMLQLTKKLGLIALRTKRPVESFRISQPERTAIVTGPLDRPPLVREYPLRLEVRAGLAEILWIVHQLAVVDNDAYPLIVRDFSIKSQNLNPQDEVQQLDAVIEIAGMQFLAEGERTAAPPPRTTPRGLGGGR